MNKKILVLLFLGALSVLQVRADTGEMLKSTLNAIASIAYISTFFSWAFLIRAIFKKKKPKIFLQIAFSILSFIIGIVSIILGSFVITTPQDLEIGQSFILWGWTIIIINLIAIAVAIYLRVSRKYPPINK